MFLMKGESETAAAVSPIARRWNSRSSHGALRVGGDERGESGDERRFSARRVAGSRAIGRGLVRVNPQDGDGRQNQRAGRDRGHGRRGPADTSTHLDLPAAARRQASARQTGNRFVATVESVRRRCRRNRGAGARREKYTISNVYAGRKLPKSSGVFFSPPLPLLVDQAVANREQRELEAISHVALLIDDRQHVLDRLFAQMELVGDLAIGPAGGDRLNQVAFARCQPQVGCGSRHRRSTQCPDLTSSGLAAFL